MGASVLAVVMVEGKKSRALTLSVTAKIGIAINISGSDDARVRRDLPSTFITPLRSR